MIRQLILSCAAVAMLSSTPIVAQTRDADGPEVSRTVQAERTARADTLLPRTWLSAPPATVHPALIPHPLFAQVSADGTAQSAGTGSPDQWLVEVDRPDSEVRSIVEGAPQDDVERDAWGQPKSPGLAVATAYLGNFLPWAFNEVVPGRAELKISQISPRSWWRGITHGFGWDDNAFSVNFFAHPFQGNIYFNGARANGYGYWTGLATATAGSYHWECCGETHLPSINDWFNTSLGGAAFGEMLYRTSSMVLDNTATGSERAWREIGAFLINPVRGFSRLVQGNSSRVYANPEHPSDRIPERMENVFSFGARAIGKGLITDSTTVHAFLSMEMISGSLLHLDRQKPFDFFSAVVQLNFSEKQGLGKIEIRGNLWHKDLAETESVTSKLILVQDFDYDNNNAYEFGGQGVSMMYLRQSQKSERNNLVFIGAGSLMIMGAVNSEGAHLAEIPGVRERLREYDFGSGLGARTGVQFLRDGFRWIEASYRFQYLNTLNGSNANGQDAYHIIQKLRVKGLFPVGVGRWGVGADFEIHLRDSFFSADEVENVRQRSPQWRFFVTWNPTRGHGN